MVLLRSAFIVILIVASSTSEDVNTTSVSDPKKFADPKKAAAEPKQNDLPASVESRFFDLGGMLNQLFPGFNQGIQEGSADNPSGMDFPDNSQFYPGGASQGQNPQVPREQGSTFPLIDDAKQYPSQRKNKGNFLCPQSQQTQYPTFGGSQQSQYPNQGNFGGAQQSQYPNQGNFGGFQPTQYPNQGNFGGSQQNQYPNQDNFGGSQQIQYPNQGNFGGSQQSQYPNQENFGGSQQSQYPYPNQGTTGGWQQPQNPSQGNFGGSLQNQYPNQGNFGGSQQSHNPDFGGFQYPNQNNQNGGQSNDGTIDGMLPPDNPSNFAPDQFFNNGSQNQQPNGGDGQATAILGRPVVIPSTPTPEGQIFFPSSTESASRRQCVQDCATTSEYNPVCGTNNVTYFNPGRFICARNCGINVFVLKQGRCGDTPLPRNVAKINLPTDE